MKAPYGWGSFISVSAVTFVLADSARVGIAVGAFAATGMWLALSRGAVEWRQELKPFVSASDPGAVAQEPRMLLDQQTHTHRERSLRSAFRSASTKRSRSRRNDATSTCRRETRERW